MRQIPARVWRAAAVAALMLLAASAAFARQTPQPNQTGNPRPTGPDPAAAAAERRRLERERSQQEMNLRIVEQEGRRQRATPGEPRLDVRHIVDDFTLIQVASNNLAQAAQGGELDLKLVAKSAADIRKRAGRLSSSLGLPKPEKGAKRHAPEEAPDARGLKQSLTKLDALVDGFAHNPVFREINLIDAELSAKARRDLDEIIELSDWVRKHSERLQKTAAGSDR